MAGRANKVLVQLRDWIIQGEFAPGERLAEIPLAERLGVSRTPVKTALHTLEKEGLVEATSGGGFIMRRVTRQSVEDAIIVRGHLEGLAVRLIAERGISRPLLRRLTECVEEGARIIKKDVITVEDFYSYTQMNDTFHRLICEGAENLAVLRAIEAITSLPFAAASALVPSSATPEKSRYWLVLANFQHQRLVETMEAGQSVIAQAIAEEHVHISLENFRLALDKIETASELIPALNLVSPEKL